MLVLSTAYLPPISYFAAMAKDGNVVIESHETYLKQSYRNRCVFLGAQGPEPLQIPIVHNATAIRDIEIDYKTPWIKVHARALLSAYGMSPFYEHYSPAIFEILESAPKYLFDLNSRLTEYLIGKLYLDVRLTQTKDYVKDYGPEATDLRYLISPKKPSTFISKPYFQVFTPTLKTFRSDLSVIDLLFNEGPSAETFLK